MGLLTSVSGGHSLSYDPLMRLYEVAGTPTVRQAYDGAEVVVEYGATGALIRRHVYGPGADEPIIWYEGTGVADRRFVHGDERGTIFAVTNSAGGLLKNNRHDEYGRMTPAHWGRHQFTGQAYFGELGLHNFKTRFYLAEEGVFLQTDRIGYGDGLNVYNTMGGDPVNKTDPMGTDVCDLPQDQREGTVCGDSSSDSSFSLPLFWSYGGGGFGGGGGGPLTAVPRGTRPGPGTTTPQDEQCQGPPVAPNTGATPEELAAQVRANTNEAANHRVFWPIDSLLWFKSQVQNRGPWDYKQYDRGFENFGNYNYGYVGSSLGIPTGTLLRQAGAAQGRDGNPGDGGDPGNGVWGGNPPYGDQKIDQEMIKRGIQDRQNGC